MTTFIILCAVLVAAAVAVVARPLMRKHVTEGRASVSAIIVALTVPVIAVVLYKSQSNWNWDQAAATAARQQDVSSMVAGLEQRLAKEPNDVQGWLLLGQSYLTLEQGARAIDAYQRAYDLTSGTNSEAALGLAEALALTDQATLGGRAGRLFEEVLAREPQNPRALFYGAVAALTVGKLDVARERIASLLAQNPPQQIRELLERQLQDIDQQLGQSQGAAAPVAPAPGRSIAIEVALAPSLSAKVDAQSAIFILARAGAGPPLAVTRRVVADLPLKVTLSDADAMVAGRNLSSVPEVTVVARISKSGTPAAQSGDLYGEAVHRFDGSSQPIKVVIDRAVP